MPTPPPNPPPAPPSPSPPTTSPPRPSAAASRPDPRWGFAHPPVTRRDRLIAGGVLVAIAVALFMLARDHPSDISIMPACPSQKFAGIECPGCGTTRGVHHLMNWRVGDAWRHNPAMVAFGVPLFALAVSDLLWRVTRGRRVQLLMPPRAGWVIFVVLIGYTVLRNLPGERFDLFRPPPPPSSVAD